MSRGGRGGSAGAMLNIANALGFQRGDMPQSQVVSAPPPLFPPLMTLPLPRSDDPNVAAEGEFHAALCSAYAQSSYYRPPPPTSAAPLPIHRYTDKYKLSARPPFKPAKGVVPREVLFGKWAKAEGDGKGEKKSGEPVAKRRRLALERLNQLESREAQGEPDDNPTPGVGTGGREGGEWETDSEDEGGKKAKDGGLDEEEAAGSGSEAAEEDNDYATNYFDNGEAYGADDSGDNIDDDNVY